MYDNQQALWEEALEGPQHELAPCTSEDPEHIGLFCALVADDHKDHFAQGYTWQDVCERTVAGGTCTLCGHDSDELLPWASSERLCWDCTDYQLDLLALAVSGDVFAEAVRP